MLRQDISVLAVRTHDELFKEVLRFARISGFELVGAMAVIDAQEQQTRFIAVHNTPPGFMDTFQNLEMAGRDPVMQHCKCNSTPIAWGQATYVSAKRGESWEHQAAYGYKAGIAVATHLPNGRHFFIGVDRDGPLPSDSEELTRMVADVQLFAVQAQDAALRILRPEPRSDEPKLSLRELECLRWTMEGKTAWELGQILGISEQTAARHINNAAQKLGCVNKLQAVEGTARRAHLVT